MSELLAKAGTPATLASEHPIKYMKPIYCVKCGNNIESGYAINPETSAICEMCYIEEQANLQDGSNKLSL